MDAVEWRTEVERVYQELVEVEKEVELTKNQGTGLSEEIEEFRRHTDLIMEMCKEIKMSCTHQVRKVFQHAGEALDENLESIRRVEKRINQQN